MTDPRRTATGMLSNVIVRIKLLTKPASSPMMAERRYLSLLHKALMLAAFI
jgi:hypothetical protein